MVCGGGVGWCRAKSLVLPVCLQDSVLAFWSHGMQGRSLDTNEVSGAWEPAASNSEGLVQKGPAGMVSEVPLSSR